MARNSRDKEIYPITLRALEVVRVEDVSPAMRRVVFTGEQLRANDAHGVNVPELISDGFDDDIRMIFPDPETGERPHPVHHEDGSLEWVEDVMDLFRTYTVRSFDADKGELVVDFARHGQGLAEDWSGQAQPGDPIYIAGPKSCAALPIHTDWLLLAGDETALPAIGRAVESLPVNHRAIIVIEVPTNADIQTLSHGVGVDVRWAVRDQGGDFAAVVADLFDADRDGEALKLLSEGVPYVWAAGEAARLKPLRRLFKALEIPREHVEITGYWRKTTEVEVVASAAAEGAASDAADSTAEGSAEAPAPAESGLSVVRRLHDMAEFAPAFALRAAAAMDLFGQVDMGANTVTALAEKLDKDPSIMLRFLRYLASLDLLALDDERIVLSPLGSELADPDSSTLASLTGPSHEKALSFLQLEDVLSGTNNSRWDQLITRDPKLAAANHESEISSAVWAAPAVAQQLAETLPADSAIAVGGPGAAVYADEFLRKFPQATVTILGTFSEAEDQAIAQALTSGDLAEAFLRDINVSRRDRASFAQLHGNHLNSSTNQESIDPLATATAVVLIDPWEKLGTLEADVENQPLTSLINRATKARPAFLVTDILAESGAEDHDYEEDLTRLAVHGTALPTERDIARTVAASGAIATDQRPVSWSKQLISLADPSC